MTHIASVGPYSLHEVLGRGQTSVVRLGVHTQTGQKVAVKIMDKTKMAAKLLSKIEREITIMRLISHPHVLALERVFETDSLLFLVVEYVAGGDLFDLLVSREKTKLPEAMYYFRQIVAALSYCHHFNICHRDVKPENLLLDSQQKIKIADFGMATLQVHDLLETSCGSPHYAAPEVIRGIRYDGRKADSWSCGVILYALVCGCLPFDDKHIGVVLNRVKKGRYSMPEAVPDDCQDLIGRMLSVDPNVRYSMEEIQNHPCYARMTPAHQHVNNTPSSEPFHVKRPNVEVIDLLDSCQIDKDIVHSLVTLACFKDSTSESIQEKLLQKGVDNPEKHVYLLLLERRAYSSLKEDRACTPAIIQEPLVTDNEPKDDSLKNTSVPEDSSFISSTLVSAVRRVLQREVKKLKVACLLALGVVLVSVLVHLLGLVSVREEGPWWTVDT